MKKTILLALFLFAISSIFAGIAGAQVDANYMGRSPNIIASLTKQEPDPVEPGKIVEASFKLDNNGTIASNVVFEILPEYPFSLLEGESNTNFVGTLGTSQSDRQSVIVRYKLKVAQDAVDDNHKIKVRYKSDNFDSWVTIDKLAIKVQSHDAILGVEKFSTMPAVTAPGEKTKLTIELKNHATSLLKDIKVSLNLNKNGDEKVPFSPIGSTNEKVISYAEPQASLPVEFELLVDSDAVSKAYKVPLDLKYSDVLNKNYSKTNLITLVVGATPDLGVTLERTEVYTSGSFGSVVLRLVNKGPVDIKFLNVKVLQNENVKLLGADEAYIGKLDSDDFSTAEFKLFVRGKDSVKIPVEVSYRDTNNNNYRESKEVELRLYSSSEAKNFGIGKNSSLFWIAVIAIAVLAAYYYYRRRKHKK